MLKDVVRIRTKSAIVQIPVSAKQFSEEPDDRYLSGTEVERFYSGNCVVRYCYSRRVTGAVARCGRRPGVQQRNITYYMTGW